REPSCSAAAPARPVRPRPRVPSARGRTRRRMRRGGRQASGGLLTVRNTVAGARDCTSCAGSASARGVAPEKIVDNVRVPTASALARLSLRARARYFLLPSVSLVPEVGDAPPPHLALRRLRLGRRPGRLDPAEAAREK